MELEIKPETERLVQDEISRGHFHTVDELIVEGVRAWREKHEADPAAALKRSRKPLYDLLTQPPFAGSELDLERREDYPRPVNL